MAGKRKPYVRKHRQCKICHCPLEEDEIGGYCAHCREVLDQLKYLEREECRSKTPAEDLAEREARIKAHTERVFLELQQEKVRA